MLINIIFEYNGSDCFTLSTATATLKELVDTAVRLATIHDTALSDINIRLTDPVVPQSPTTATDDCFWQTESASVDH